MDGNDFIQSRFASERHSEFEREVEKDRLAQLAGPRTANRRVLVLARHIRRFVRSHARRARALPANDV